MDALAIASGAIAILREAMKSIEEQVKDGVISVEAQQAQVRKIDAIRDGKFEGPEWVVTNDTPPPPPAPMPPA